MGERRTFPGTLNRIQSIWENPCEAPWTVYVQTAVPALADAMLVLFIPQPQEILENYLEPKQSRGTGRRGDRDDPRRRRTRGGRFRRAFRRGFPDVDSQIAERIFGRDFFRKRNPGGLERFLWTGINIADRVLWYWLVLDVGRDFIYNWSSGIMESRFCSMQFNSLYQGELIEPQTTDENPFQEQFFTPKESERWQWDSSILETKTQNPATVSIVCAATVHFEPFSSWPLFSPICLRCLDEFNNQLGEVCFDVGEEGGTFQYDLFIEEVSVTGVQFFMSTSSNLIEVQQATINVFGTEEL